jgi:hypothetical protein
MPSLRAQNQSHHPNRAEILERDRHIADALEHRTDVPLDEWASILEGLESAERLGYCESLPLACRGEVTVRISKGGRKVSFTFDPSRPTSAIPGSAEKVAVMEERARRGLPLHLRGDFGWG